MAHHASLASLQALPGIGLGAQVLARETGCHCLCFPWQSLDLLHVSVQKGARKVVAQNLAAPGVNLNLGRCEKGIWPQSRQSVVWKVLTSVGEVLLNWYYSW
jgi:hypothetical protein